MESLEYYLAARYKRLLAYLIDILLIVIIIFFLCYNFFGLDEVWNNYLHNRGDLLSRIEFLRYRNRIRDFSFLVWVIYAFILEASAQQGTLGKRIMHIKVINASGDRMSFKQSAIRNFCKILSYIPLSLGFLWLIFDRNRQGWHDKIGGTFVVDADFVVEDNGDDNLEAGSDNILDSAI